MDTKLPDTRFTILDEKQVEKQRATQLEKEDRIQYMAQLISRQHHPSALKVFAERYKVTLKQAYEYLNWAKEKLNGALKDRYGEIAVEAYRFYRSICKDPELPLKFKFQAYAALRQLAGTDAPQHQRIEISSLERYSDAELEQLATKMGLSADTISRTNGRQSNPSPHLELS
jgi:hypothetical protein